MIKSDTLRLLALFSVIAVIAAALFLMLRPGDDTAAIGEHETDTPSMHQYDNASFGLRFSYPDTYKLTERDMEGSAERAHHSIVLTDKVAAANLPTNGEGPTAITIDIFSNEIDKLPLQTWINNTSRSNFKLSPDGRLSTSTIAGLQGYAYTWDGLYRGESTVVSRGSDIIMFTVTYMDATDRIHDDFGVVLMSTQLR